MRQGGVLSPLLFAVYIDKLLIRLERLRTGCYSGCFFVGALCYADDIVLLAPSPSALRILLSECECFSRDSELNFNASKTQLICFRLKVLPDGMFCFFGHILSFSNCVHHLGHVLSFNFDDSEDINRVSMDMSRKANYLLYTFKSCSPLVIKLFCLLHIVSHFMELFPGFFVLNRLDVSKLRLITSYVKFGTCLSFVIPGFYIVSPVFRVCIILSFIYLYLLLAKQLPQIVV